MSSIAATAYDAWRAFDDDPGGLNLWAAQSGRYNGTDGTYVGPETTNGYGGEWLQISMPYSREVVEYTIYARNNAGRLSPTAWKVFVSDDAITWTEIDEVAYGDIVWDGTETPAWSYTKTVAVSGVSGSYI